MFDVVREDCHERLVLRFNYDIQELSLIILKREDKFSRILLTFNTSAEPFRFIYKFNVTFKDFVVTVPFKT